MAEKRQDRARPDKGTTFRFDADYLKGGYFDERKHLRPEILDELAVDVAIALANANTKPHQLRRFFNQARAIERSLDGPRAFEEVRADIVAFKSIAASQVGRKLVGEDFKRFIDVNVDLAKQSEVNFRRGFMPHFAAVLGFFVYRTRGKE